MGAIVLLGGLAAFCVLLWNFAVYALPAFIGLSAGFWALNHGAGLVSIPLGLLTGVGTLLLARLAFCQKSRALRWLTLALFVLPAAFAGYSIAIQLLSMDGDSPSSWHELAAASAAIAVGGAAFHKLAIAQPSSAA